MNYQVTVNNLQKGSIARNLVISDLSLPEGLTLDGAEDAVTVSGAVSYTHLDVYKRQGIVIPVSFYEKEVNNTYNSVAVLDADGKNLGVYRKTHIPDDHYYQEKFYFTPGDTGFKVFDTRFGTIGVGICWDCLLYTSHLLRN